MSELNSEVNKVIGHPEKRVFISIKADDNSRRVITLWTSIVGFFAVFFSAVIAGLISVWLLIFTAVIGVGGVFIAIVFPKLYCDTYCVVFDGDSIDSKMGAFLKKEIFIPVRAFRTFEIISSPLQGLFECRTVVIRYAGGATYFPALPKKDAEMLIELLEKINLNVI